MATGPGSTRGQPQLKRAPRHPAWSRHVAPWLGRRAHGAGDALTARLGGPARRRVIVSLGLVLGLSAADVSSIGAIAAQLQAGLGIGTAGIGLLATASALVGALAAIPFGLLVDKTRRVDVLAASVLLWGVAEAASAFAGSFTMLLLTRLLLGAVTATAVPAVASLTGDFFPAGERGRIYGYIVAGEVVGAGVGIGVSSLVSAALGWRAAFLVLAIPSLALAWYLWKRLPEPARGGQSRLEPGATRIITAEEAGPAAAGRRRGARARGRRRAPRRAAARRGAGRGADRGGRPGPHVAPAGGGLRAARAHQRVHHPRVVPGVPLPLRRRHLRRALRPRALRHGAGGGDPAAGRSWEPGRCSAC